MNYVESLDNANELGYSIDRIDNDDGYKRGNLRWVTHNIQMRNTRKLQSNNNTGFRGVYKRGNRFSAKICVDYKVINFGSFDKKIDAAKAYDEYVKSHGLEHTLNL